MAGYSSAGAHNSGSAARDEAASGRKRQEPLQHQAPRLAGLATAVPAHLLRQTEVAAGAARLFAGAFADWRRLEPVYGNAAIETRHSSVPLGWYLEPHGFAERNARYLESAVMLLEQAARRALDDAGLGAEAVDAVVTVSSSGIATPALDARLMQRLGFRSDIQRLPIFGLGCAGGVIGLSRAAQIARAEPGAIVLFLVVELCGLTFRYADRSKENVIATALFGDGAAAAVIAAGGDGPVLGPAGEHTWPDSLDVMGWDVRDDGLAVVFSRDIPAWVRRHFRSATDAFLAKHGVALADIDGFLCHPGGAKVIAALEEVLELQSGGLADARAVLRDHGNMSAATVLFVLERALARGVRGRQLLSALGPGFSAAFLLLEID